MAGIKQPKYLYRWEVEKRIRNNADTFEQFYSEVGLVEMGRKLNLRMRSVTRIVDEWPCKIEDGVRQSVFDEVMALDYWGSERYVEWERV